MASTVNGLEGVVAAETALSSVDGEAGELLIAGYPVGELAPEVTFEETVWLLWHGELPGQSQLHSFRNTLSGRRQLSDIALSILQSAATAGLDIMDALRLVAGTVSLTSHTDEEAAVDLLANAPVFVAAYWRLLHSQTPLAPRTDLGHAANYLYMLTGAVPSSERVQALDTYLNTVVDHGLNASTFTARVIVSTGSDLVSAIVGAIGALKGPLHGGAPGPALDMVFEIGDAARSEEVLRKKIESGERLMGFGHRIYKVRDPRADVLSAAAQRLFRNSNDPSKKVYDLARSVEQTAIRLLEEYKPGRHLQTNVEFYTALLLHSLDLEVPLFTPTFAISRTAGWLAHGLEQRAAKKLIRPQSRYVGPTGRSMANRLQPV